MIGESQLKLRTNVDPVERGQARRLGLAPHLGVLVALLLPLSSCAMGLAPSDWRARFSQAPAEARVLIVGDSQSVGVLGRATVDQMLSQGFTQAVAVRARCGASPLTFLQQPTPWNCGAFDRSYSGAEMGPVWERREVTPLPRLLEELQPTLLWVQLGGNLAKGSPERWERELEAFLKVLAPYPDMKCLWVGPPPGWGRDPERFPIFYRALAEKVSSRCAFFDSRTVVRFPDGVGDGIHLDSITAEELERKLGCPRGPVPPHRPECASAVERADQWAQALLEWAWVVRSSSAP